MRLISMTDFVLEQKETSTIDLSQIMWYDEEFDKLVKIRNYANFLKQPLKLEMFVPCRGDGSLLSEPRISLGSIGEYVKEQEQAKEKVLFSGIEMVQKEHQKQSIRYRYTVLFWELTTWQLQSEFNTVEDLVNLDIQLTANAKKQIGL